MGETSKIECRWCGAMASLMILKRDHGRWAPKCVSARTEKRLREKEWCAAGQYAAVLTLAGITKMAPLYRWWNEPVYGDPNRHTGEVKVIGWTKMEIISYEPVVPEWAWHLAHRLTTDKQLARRLGHVQRKRLRIMKRPMVARKSGKRGTVHEEDRSVEQVKVWEDCDIDKAMPIERRARILRVAASNPLARELIYDDPEAAAVIIAEVHQ